MGYLYLLPLTTAAATRRNTVTLLLWLDSIMYKPRYDFISMWFPRPNKQQSECADVQKMLSVCIFFTSVNSFKQRCFCVHRKRLTLIHTRTLKMAEGILCVRFRWISASFWSFLHSLCRFSYLCDPLMLSFWDFYWQIDIIIIIVVVIFFTSGSGHKKQHKITTLHTNMHSLSAAIGHVLFTCISM